ncbi:hypothetical protein G7Y89_g2804 [Cudoniella acicularis]|uniref:mannan endo-1,6-alpha-mannosidase n=1 Tax=Cudoniella acicularis TaxID=354080 RepID=A0A8H4RTF9_9HELO|nr:hypothetical protein G7Y89_g2804 [Cudoniella acicularis]
MILGPSSGRSTPAFIPNHPSHSHFQLKVNFSRKRMESSGGSRSFIELSERGSSNEGLGGVRGMHDHGRERGSTESEAPITEKLVPGMGKGFRLKTMIDRRDGSMDGGRRDDCANWRKCDKEGGKGIMLTMTLEMSRQGRISPLCLLVPPPNHDLTMAPIIRICVALSFLLAQCTNAIDLDVNSTDSIMKATSIMAYDLVTFYQGNQSGQIPGLLPSPYYWWEAGAMFGSLIEYWHRTGDTTYNDITIQAMGFQIGEKDDYAPANQTAALGNDDQAFWAMTALAAAEYNFPQSPDPNVPSWLALAQAVFNEQTSRWDTVYCNGGLRWQVTPTNPGYNLKNTISNGCLFNIAARLARYTGDQMYADWAVKIWDWLTRIGLVDPNTYECYDNSEAVINNCTQIDHDQWTYNAGTMLMGASTMYNFTNGSSIWQNRTQGLINTLGPNWFPDGVMREGCETAGGEGCNYDQKSFKAYLARWMAITTKMAPFTYNQILALLTTSAKAAAAQCTGGTRGSLCGIQWTLNGTWDGTSGPGQQMCALEVTLGLLIHQTVAPLTVSTGGTSASNPTAGQNSTLGTIAPPTPISTRDRAGAWFLTVFIALMATWSIWFMWSTAWEARDPAPRLAEKMKIAASVVDLNAAKGKGKGKEPALPTVASGALPVISEAEKGRLPRWLGGNRVT